MRAQACRRPAVLASKCITLTPMTTRPHVRITPEDYLRTERAAEWKSEYIDGEMFAMAGASPRHVLIATNVASELRNQLREGPCTVYTADLRVSTDRQRH